VVPLSTATHAHEHDGPAADLSDLSNESGAERADRRERKQLAGLGLSVELAPRRWRTGSPRARRRTTICWRRCRSAARTSGDPRIRDWPADHFYQSYDRQKPSSCWKASASLLACSRGSRIESAVCHTYTGCENRCYGGVVVRTFQLRQTAQPPHFTEAQRAGFAAAITRLFDEHWQLGSADALMLL